MECGCWRQWRGARRRRQGAALQTHRRCFLQELREAALLRHPSRRLGRVPQTLKTKPSARPKMPRVVGARLARLPVFGARVAVVWRVLSVYVLAADLVSLSARRRHVYFFIFYFESLESWRWRALFTFKVPQRFRFRAFCVPVRYIVRDLTEGAISNN